MDSLTQALLGATSFALIKHKQIGNRSLIMGAICGTIPDLDVLLFPFYNEIEHLLVHRGFSHSILFAVLLTIIFSELAYKLYKKQFKRLSWYTAFFLALMTHAILDCFTTYGTQLLNPFSSQLISFNSIHVIEPVYTLILLAGIVLILVKKHMPTFSQSILNYSLVLSTSYLIWTIISKEIAEESFIRELQRQKISYQDIKVSPTPLNTLLWHGIVKSDKGYYFATYSLLDKRSTIDFFFESSNTEVISRIKQNKLVSCYLQHTQKFELIRQNPKGQIQIFAIKYGPINYFGKPEFIFPLCLNEYDLRDEYIYIDKSDVQFGPLNQIGALFKRIGGI